MLYEGIKETQNTRIERDEENRDEIEMLYSFGVVIFEHVILQSTDKIYSICYFAPEDIYDIVIESRNQRKVFVFESKRELSAKLKKFFQLNKNDRINDDEEILCTSHSIEYTL